MIMVGISGQFFLISRMRYMPSRFGIFTSMSIRSKSEVFIASRALSAAGAEETSNPSASRMRLQLLMTIASSSTTNIFMLCDLLFHWQPDGKSTSASDLALNPDGSPMALNNSIGYRQSQPRSLSDLLCCKEWIKQFVEVLGRYATARVCANDLQTFLIGFASR